MCRRILDFLFGPDQADTNPDESIKVAYADIRSAVPGLGLPSHPYRTAGPTPPTVVEPTVVEPEPEPYLKSRMERAERMVMPSMMTKWDHVLDELRRLEPDVVFEFKGCTQDVIRGKLTIRYGTQTGIVEINDWGALSDWNYLDPIWIEQISAEIQRQKDEEAHRTGPKWAGKPRRLQTRTPKRK